MEGTPHLLTDVKFSERRRGYAPEEVDNFLERVSAAVAQLQDKLRDATARAEEADARINEAKRAQTVAEAQVDQLKAEIQKLGDGPAPVAAVAPPPSVDPADDAEAASTLLLMAKKTADATIEDARNEAHTTLSEAQERATTLVADAEAEASAVRSHAEATAQNLIEEQRAAAQAEVIALEELKTSIQADIQALQVHVERERADLRAAVTRLSEVIDNPAALRVADAPVGDTEGLDALVAPAAGVEAIDEIDDPAPIEDDAVPAEAFDEEPSSADGDPDFEVEIIEAAIVETEDGELVEVVDVVQAAGVDTDDGDAIEVVEELEFAEIGVAESPSDEVSDADEAERLFADESEPITDSGPPTQAFKPFADDASDEAFEGPRDEDEDKAMRAFFETDFESMEADKRGRWRR